MKVKCPTCGQPHEYRQTNPYRPFCSERCQLIDQGAWADNRYVIEGEPGSADRLSPEGLNEAMKYRQDLDARTKK